MEAGAHRAVYDNKNRSQVDVIYHDPTKKPNKPGGIDGFSMATYIPRASPNVTVQAPAAVSTSASTSASTNGIHDGFYDSSHEGSSKTIPESSVKPGLILC
ncbi:hypothetical protein N7528_003606 [Penicillium herquei]|nr:hypothetical protein N7528_003606 [Penicillium herquei]